MPWDPPGAVDDLALARLPFPTAQRLLRGSRAVLGGSAVRAVCEWHGAGEDGDPERGSFVMVREDGPLGELVGERLRISAGRIELWAYCHRSADLDDDLSVTRRLFAVMAPLSVTSVSVTVEVVV